MARVAARIGFIEFFFALGMTAVLGRAFQLQVVEGRRWAREAATQRTVQADLPARRGALYDRNGIPLAITQEFYHVGIAPNEVVDRQAAIHALARQLSVPAGSLERGFRSHKYLYFHGPFTATQVQPLRPIRGVHLNSEFQRAYPSRDLARAVIGRLGGDEPAGASGLELALDSILTGQPGAAVLLKDRAGRRYDSPSRLTREPVAGSDVVLTIDAELQEIAERGLADALDTLDAEGGDVVFLDVRTGELLALASRRRGSDGLTRASMFTDPFEPGSTAKLFAAAALLRYGRVDSTDTVSGENGVWLMPVHGGKPRLFTDSHKQKGRLTLAQAIEVSSNIAMAKFSARLSSEELFEVLRDFGFGSPTGVEFPSESRGLLSRPDKWQPDFSRASMAIGYEFGVTPVQLAAAYAAIANDGVLLTPTLVREVRSPTGQVLYRHQPEPVRRAVSSDVAARLHEFLRRAVSEGGTGGEAQLANYSLVGKTGTARRFVGGRYARGEYTASFAALFPADHPQLVVIVKLDNPKAGSYYGGRTAAPVTRAMLQQALASRGVAIDRSRLATRDTTALLAARAPEPPVGLGRTLTGAVPVVLSWPRSPQDSAVREQQRVPDVAGSAVREATLALHRRGFQVVLHGHGVAVRTTPAAGEAAAAGSTVSLWADE